MTTETNINRPTFLTISLLTIILCGLLALVNLGEFYTVGILKNTDGYPFGGEGPTPFYYKTAKLYSTVNLIWGLIFFTTLFFTIRTAVKGQQKNVFWFFGLTVLLILAQLLHGQMGT